VSAGSSVIRARGPTRPIGPATHPVERSIGSGTHLSDYRRDVSLINFPLKIPSPAGRCLAPRRRRLRFHYATARVHVHMPPNTRPHIFPIHMGRWTPPLDRRSLRALSALYKTNIACFMRRPSYRDAKRRLPRFTSRHHVGHAHSPTAASEKCAMQSVIRQKTASPSCHPLRWLMHSFAAYVGNAHSPTAAGAKCAMHSWVDTLQWPALPHKSAHSHGGPGPRLIHGSLDPHEAVFQTASRSVKPFLHSSSA